jgi:tRNA(Ile)-lysidine synthase
LAALSRACRIELCAAHWNHQLRGDESLRDQCCAEVVARQLGIPCVVGSGASLAGAPNLEARAREERYAFFTRVAAAQGCAKIATGHTLDDQAETVLMRLLRGTGGDGLTGIHPVRGGRIIRPLIECSRVQVLAFLDSAELPFCEDNSNQDRRFLRNRVRHEVLPLLRAINPDVTGSLASVAEIAAEQSAVLAAVVEPLLASSRSGDGSLSVGALTGSAPALRSQVVRAWLREQRGDLRQLLSAHIRGVVDLAQGVRPNGRIRLPGGQLVVREYGWLHFRAREPAPLDEPGRILVPGTALQLASGWQISAEVVAGQGASRPTDLWGLVADAEAIATPLLIRSARPGDRIEPLGLGGHRKLQDIFVDRKLPLGRRRSCPVVECNGEILWVPGVVRSRIALITPATRATLRLVARQTGIAGA